MGTFVPWKKAPFVFVRSFFGDENRDESPSNLIGWTLGVDCGEAWRSSESETHAAGRRWIGGWKKLVGERLVTVNGKQKIQEKTHSFFLKRMCFMHKRFQPPKLFCSWFFFLRSVYQPSPVEDSGNFDPKPINDSPVKHPRSFVVGCAWVNEWMHMWRLRCNGPRPPEWMDGYSCRNTGGSQWVHTLGIN